MSRDQRDLSLRHLALSWLNLLRFKNINIIFMALDIIKSAVVEYNDDNDDDDDDDDYYYYYYY